MSDEGGCLVGVDLQTGLNHLFYVVFALIDLTTAIITDALLLGWAELCVVAAATASTNPATTQAVNQDIVGDNEADHTLNDDTSIIKRLGLLPISGEPVEDVAALRVITSEAILNQAKHHLIGDEVALVHIGLGGATQLAPLSNRTPEDVTSGDLRDVERLHQSS